MKTQGTLCKARTGEAGVFHLADWLGQINHCLNVRILTCNNFCYFMVYVFVTRLTFELLRIQKTEQSTFDFTPKNTAGLYTQFHAVITRLEKWWWTQSRLGRKYSIGRQRPSFSVLSWKGLRKSFWRFFAVCETRELKSLKKFSEHS